MNATELANKLRLKFPKLKDMADSDVIETVSKKYPKIKESLTEEKKSKRKFVLVTKDFSGMGFAIQEIQKNNSEVLIAYKLSDKLEKDEIKEYKQMGKGFVEKIELDELMQNRKDYKDFYFLWDGNHNYEEGEILIKEGFKVWGGSKFTYDLENDREFGVKFAEG